MTAVRRLRRQGLPCLIALILSGGLAGCGGDSGADADAPASSQASGGGASGSAGGPAPAPAPDVSVAETIIDLTVTKGVPSPDVGQVAVPMGNTVRLIVTADVADEVHVHGYELTLDLAAGVPAELTFVADVPGIFEVELHEGGQLLCELRVE